MYYSLSIVFFEDIYEITVNNCYLSESRQEIEEFAEYLCKGCLLYYEDVPYIALCNSNLTAGTLFPDKEVVIRKICDDKIKQLKEPLDVRISGNAEIAVEAIKNRDPGYSVEEKDMVDTNFKLGDLVNIFGTKKVFTSIAYGVDQI